MFQYSLNEMFQHDYYGLGNSLLTRLLPAIRHTDTKTHATAMQTGFLHFQTK